MFGDYSVCRICNHPGQPKVANIAPTGQNRADNKVAYHMDFSTDAKGVTPMPAPMHMHTGYLKTSCLNTIKCIDKCNRAVLA